MVVCMPKPIVSKGLVRSRMRTRLSHAVKLQDVIKTSHARHCTHRCMICVQFFCVAKGSTDAHLHQQSASLEQKGMPHLAMHSMSVKNHLPVLSQPCCATCSKQQHSDALDATCYVKPMNIHQTSMRLQHHHRLQQVCVAHQVLNKLCQYGKAADAAKQGSCLRNVTDRQKDIC